MTATSPTPLLVPAAPPAQPRRNAVAGAGQKADSFAQQLARQRSNAAADARPDTNAPARTTGGKPAGNTAGAQEPVAEGQDDAQVADPVSIAAAGAAAVQVQAQPLPAPPAGLPAQALEIAAQAAQLQQAIPPGATPGASASVDAAATPGLPAAPAAAISVDMAGAAVAQTSAPLPAATTPARTAAPHAAASAIASVPDARATARDARAAPTPAPHLAATTFENLVQADGEADAALRSAAGNPPLAGTSGPSAHAAGTEAAAGLVAATPLLAARPDTAATSLLPPGAGPLALGMGTPVAATPAWGADLGRQLVILSHDATQGRQTAELRLDPPDLGPLRVTLSVTDGVASASFVSAHAAVRHAVEAALPQLQQALAQAGLSLGQANVGEHGGQSGFDMQQHNSRGQGQGGGGDGQAAVALASQVPAAARRGDGLVDTFA